MSLILVPILLGLSLFNDDDGSLLINLSLKRISLTEQQNILIHHKLSYVNNKVLLSSSPYAVTLLKNKLLKNTHPNKIYFLLNTAFI